MPAKRDPSKTSVSEASTMHTEDSAMFVSLSDRMNGIQESLNLILQKMDSSSTQYETLNKKINGKGGINDEIAELQEGLGTSTTEVTDLQRIVTNQQREISTLKYLVIHLSNKVELQENQLSDLGTRSMGDNIIVHNLVEDESENLETEVNKFITQELKLPKVKFDRIHRSGATGPQSKRPRIIVAHLSDPSRKEVLMKAAAAYRKSSPDEDGIRFSNQYPEDIRDKRQRLFQKCNQYQEENIQCQVKHDKLVFKQNGSVYQEKVHTPKPFEILEAASDPKKCELLENIDVCMGNKHRDKRNTIYSTACSVDSYSKVRNFALKSMLEDKRASATSNVLVYSFVDKDGKLQEGWDNDHEYGAGQAILRYMQENENTNCAVMMSRWLGDHLGPSRHRIFANNAASALDKL